MDSNALLAAKIEALEEKYAVHDQPFQLVFEAIKQLNACPALPAKELGFHTLSSTRKASDQTRIKAEGLWGSDFDFREIGVCRVEKEVGFVRDEGAGDSEYRMAGGGDPTVADGLASGRRWFFAPAGREIGEGDAGGERGGEADAEDHIIQRDGGVEVDEGF